MGLNVLSAEYCFICGASNVAGMDMERECSDCGPCGGLRLMDGPNRCLGFNIGGNLSGEEPEAELESKKEGGSGLSRQTLAVFFGTAVPLPPTLGLLWITSNSASRCVLALGSSITDVFLSSPARVPSPPVSLMAALKELTAETIQYALWELCWWPLQLAAYGPVNV